MTKKIITKNIKRDFKRNIQQLVRDLSQPFVIIQESPMFVDCPNCIWDSINKKSANIFDASFTSPETIFVGTDQQRTITPVPFDSGRCPVCIGEGQLFTTKELTIPAMINYVSSWRFGSEYYDLPVGKEGVNFAIVKTLSCYYELLAQNSIFIIHNRIKVEKFKPPFVRGIGGEDAVVQMAVQTVEAGEQTTGKFDGLLDPLSRDNVDHRRKIKGPTATRILTGRNRGQGG